MPMIEVYSTSSLAFDIALLGVTGWWPYTNGFFYPRGEDLGYGNAHTTPAEYLIDILNRHGKETGGDHDFEKYYAESDLCKATLATLAEAKEKNKEKNHNSPLWRDNPSSVSARNLHPQKHIEFTNGPLRELLVLLRYKGLIRMKHPLFVITRVGLYVLFAALLASFFYGQDRQGTGIFNISGFIFITAIAPCFMAQVFVVGWTIVVTVVGKQATELIFLHIPYTIYVFTLPPSG